MRIKIAIFSVVVSLMTSTAIYGVEPSEILNDPVLEERARNLSKGLRCLVCQNESIDESHADLARDLRVLVRQRLVEGDSDPQVIDYIVSRYGDYVLLRTPARGVHVILWASGPVFLVLGGLIAFAAIRHRAKPSGALGDALDPDEQERLKQILKR